MEKVAYPSLGPLPNSGYPTNPNAGYPTNPTVAPIVPGYIPVNLSGASQRMTCPHCFAEIATRVKYRDGRMAHIIAVLLCVFGCICCVCCPYFIDSCKDADHECPNCNKFIGSYRR